MGRYFDKLGERWPGPRIGRRALSLLCLVLLLCAGGAASAQSSGGPTFTAAEMAILADNPALAELGATSPELLREILARIEAILANPGTTRGGLEGLDAETARLLSLNPTLMQAYRSSPEASAELLELIRTAAGGGKSTK